MSLRRWSGIWVSMQPWHRYPIVLLLCSRETAKLKALSIPTKSWKVIKDESYQPCSTDNSERLKEYIVIGPGDQLDAPKYPWGWELLKYNNSKWAVPEIISNPDPTGYGTDNQWTVVPRGIPLMEENRAEVQQSEAYFRYACFG